LILAAINLLAVIHFSIGGQEDEVRNYFRHALTALGLRPLSERLGWTGLLGLRQLLGIGPDLAALRFPSTHARTDSAHAGSRTSPRQREA